MTKDAHTDRERKEAATGAASAEGAPEAKEWYLLLGIRGKTLSPDYVEACFSEKKVTIRGAYSRQEILKYVANGMVNKDTILFRDGDAEWRPFGRQDAFGGTVARPSTARPSAAGPSVVPRLAARWDSALDSLKAGKKLVLTVAVAVVVAYFVYDYYYYKPEQIYGRIKDSVLLISTEDNEGRTTSLGSGFVLSDEGIVVTNLHVVKTSAILKVKSGGGVSYQPEGVVYLDERNDLALLKVTKKADRALKTLQIGKAEGMKVGERVYAVGSPAGLEFSLSEGILSGKRSEDPVSKESRELLQITAPISPGNSGGPVLNEKGQVVGVATLASRNDLQNLNFAVPLNVLKELGTGKPLQYRFLPEKPKWTPVHATLRYRRGSDEEAQDTPAFSSFYNAETVVKNGDKARVWLKVHIPQRPAIHEFWSADLLALIEVSCRLNAYRFNILVGEVDEDEEKSGSDANFSEKNEWRPIQVEDRTFFDKVCSGS